MIAFRPARRGLCLILAFATVCVGTAWAQAPGQARRSGGLLPTRETPSVSGGQTREEMLRRFDLDADGRIDEGEAEAARARMRRDKIQAMRNSGIDPVTGRPRGADTREPVAEPQDSPDDLRFPTDDPPAPPRRKPDGEAEKKPAPKLAPALPPGRAPVITGGVRAGAPAVRPGYGASGPKQELNAGRPREPQLTPGQARVRAGMQPVGRAAPQPGAPRAAAPRPGLFPQGSAQPTAEDFGR